MGQYVPTQFLTPLQGQLPTRHRLGGAVRRLGGISLVAACICFTPMAPLLAQQQGALQATARVLLVQPSREALIEAFDPANRLMGASLVQITRTLALSDDSARKARRPREIVTIAFVRN